MQQSRYRHDGGYIDRVDPFNLKTVQANSNFSDSYALRAAVTAAPTEWLKITPSIYFQKVNTNDSAAYYEYLSDPSEGKFKNGRLLRQPNQDQFVLPSLKLEADLGGVTLTSVSSYLDRKGSVLADITSFYGAVTVGYGNPMGLAGLADAVAKGARVAFRPDGAGAQQLLLGLLKRDRLELTQISRSLIAPTGPDIAQAIRSGHADCGIATRSVATAAGVDFIPLLTERFDLLVRQRDSYRTPLQGFLSLLRQPIFTERARELGGLDVTCAGSVRWAP